MWRLIARGSVLAILAVCLVPAAFAQPAFIGFIEKPAEGSTVTGMVLVQGWALDPTGISRVDFYVDDVFQYSADINLPRIDVVEAHPDWEGIQNRLPGFQTGFQARRFSNGAHIISMRVITSDNQTFEIGRRTVIVDGTKNQSPFGYVDTPDSVAIYDVNGSFPVSGWVTDTFSGETGQASPKEVDSYSVASGMRLPISMVMATSERISLRVQARAQSIGR